MLFNSIQTSARSLHPPWPPSAVGQQRDLLSIGGLSISPRSHEVGMRRQHDSGLTIRTPPSAPQLSAFPSSPPPFRGALIASWSCSQIPQVIVFPQPQELQPAEAAVPEGSSFPLSGLQLIFFHIFLRGRGARTGC